MKKESLFNEEITQVMILRIDSKVAVRVRSGLI